MKLNPDLKMKKDFNSIALKMLIFAMICGALYWYATIQFNELAGYNKPRPQTTIIQNLK